MAENNSSMVEGLWLLFAGWLPRNCN